MPPLPSTFPTEPRGGPPVVLVTGASSGIGLALAEELRASEYRAVLTARKESLGELKRRGFQDGERMLVLPLDVTRDAERRAAIAEVEARWGGVDVLINNAAISYRAVLEDMSEEEERLQQATNYLGPMALCRLVLPHMRRQRWGRLVNVSSVSGMMAMPTMGSYTASKHALEGASEALWYEMKPWNVRVTLVRPGFVRSSSFEHVHTPRHPGSEAQGRAPYAAYYEGMERLVERLMKRAWSSPEDVARLILATASRRRPPLRVSGTPDARLFYLLRRLLPRRLYHLILYHALPGVHHWVPPVEGPAGRDSGAEPPRR